MERILTKLVCLRHSIRKTEAENIDMCNNFIVFKATNLLFTRDKNTILVIIKISKTIICLQYLEIDIMWKCKNSYNQTRVVNMHRV